MAITEISALAESDATWTLQKASNATVLRLGRGQSATVSYKVTATRWAPRVHYSVSGVVTVSPSPNGAPAAISSVSITLSSGDSAPALCSPVPNGDGSRECRFGAVPYSSQGMAPAAGTAVAAAVLADGRSSASPARPFDFTLTPQGLVAGGRADLTDTFDPGALAAAEAGGVSIVYNALLKPPGEDEIPLTLSDTGAFEYTVNITVRKCGRWTLPNTANLAPLGGSIQAPIVARHSLTIEVQGCPLPVEAAMGILSTYVHTAATWNVIVSVPANSKLDVQYNSGTSTPLITTTFRKTQQPPRRFVAGTIRLDNPNPAAAMPIGAVYATSGGPTSGSRVRADCPGSPKSLPPGAILMCAFNVSWPLAADGSLGGVVLDVDGSVAAVAADAPFGFAAALQTRSGATARITNVLRLLGADGKPLAIPGGAAAAAAAFRGSGDVVLPGPAARVIPLSETLYTQGLVGPFPKTACGSFKLVVAATVTPLPEGPYNKARTANVTIPVTVSGC